MVIAVPFVVEGWHAPAGRRTREPRPLAQARQIGPAAPVGARNWDPAGKPVAGQPQRRRPDRRSGRVPGPDATPEPPQHPGSRAACRKHSSHPPCRIFASRSSTGRDAISAQITSIWTVCVVIGLGADVRAWIGHRGHTGGQDLPAATLIPLPGFRARSGAWLPPCRPAGSCRSAPAGQPRARGSRSAGTSGAGRFRTWPHARCGRHPMSAAAGGGPGSPAG
jgi:hypothetical protein